jgi:hypothetical protein
MLSRREWRKKRYAEDPEYRQKVLARGRAYHLAHKEEIRARKSRKWKTDPEYRAKHYAGRVKLQRKIQLNFGYGISLEDYDILLARQGGACAICGQPSERPLCVDHCHVTGRVRGLLCRNCNSAIGFYCDDPSLTRAAADYLAASHGDEQASTGRVDRPERE